jgi:hypothetical protein
MAAFDHPANATVCMSARLCIFCTPHLKFNSKPDTLFNSSLPHEKNLPPSSPLSAARRLWQKRNPPFYTQTIRELAIPIAPRIVIPFTAICLIAVVLAATYVSVFTRFGRNVYAIGSHENSARLMGVPVGPTKIGTYALAGFLSALGGCVATFYMQSGNPASFVGLELDAIAAVVIGGTLLTGGVGFVPGALMGVAHSRPDSDVDYLSGQPEYLVDADCGRFPVAAVHSFAESNRQPPKSLNLISSPSPTYAPPPDHCQAAGAPCGNRRPFASSRRRNVFNMYKVHQDAASLPVELTASEYKVGDRAIPSVHASASRDKAGRIQLSVTNLQPQEAAKITVKLTGAAMKDIAGQVLTAPTIDAHNTFESPEAVKPAPFTALELKDDELTLTLPAKSVVVASLN